MPDITMCSNSDCPIRMNCYRFTAIPNKYSQSFTKFIYNNGCDKFDDNKNNLK